MNVAEAEEYLEGLDNPEERIALIVIREDEIKQLVGETYPNEDFHRLTNLISRTPDCTDIDGNYWYEYREIFANLIRAGVNYLERRKEEIRIEDANVMLQEELGLKNIVISLGNTEIRPLAVFSEKDVVIRNGNNDVEINIEAGSCWADVLRKVDASNTDDHHIFLESLSWNEKENRIDAWFGS